MTFYTLALTSARTFLFELALGLLTLGIEGWCLFFFKLVYKLINYYQSENVFILNIGRMKTQR